MERRELKRKLVDLRGDERRGRRVYHTALARVVTVFGAAHPHPNHAYLFANQRANRMKVLGG